MNFGTYYYNVTNATSGPSATASRWRTLTKLSCCSALLASSLLCTFACAPKRVALQTGLMKLGFNPGKIDGVIGHDGKAALRAYQKTHGLPADGFPTMQVLAGVLTEVKAKNL